MNLEKIVSALEVLAVVVVFLIIFILIGSGGTSDILGWIAAAIFGVQLVMCRCKGMFLDKKK